MTNKAKDGSMFPPQSQAEIQRDIAHFEAQLSKLPPESDDPDDHIAREIFKRLIENCRGALCHMSPGNSRR